MFVCVSYVCENGCVDFYLIHGSIHKIDRFAAWYLCVLRMFVCVRVRWFLSHPRQCPQNGQICHRDRPTWLFHCVCARACSVCVCFICLCVCVCVDFCLIHARIRRIDWYAAEIGRRDSFIRDITHSHICDMTQSNVIAWVCIQIRSRGKLTWLFRTWHHPFIWDMTQSNVFALLRTDMQQR